MTKIKRQEDKLKSANQLGNSIIETDSNLKLENAKFNVIHSSEISKVLRELTQCIANDHDLFTSKFAPMDCSESQTSKETENSIMKLEMPSSTSTNLSTTSKPVIDKHICLQCGKQFNKRDFLQKHKIVHEIPRHKCGACDKSFVREDKLKRHFTSIHSKHRPHICEVCSKAFARKDKLKDHQKHHVTAGNSFQCAECNIPFVQKSDLNRHCRGIHKGEPGIGINIPSKRFVKTKSGDELASISTVSGTEEPLKSPGCGATAMMLASSFYPLQSSSIVPPPSSAESGNVAFSDQLSKGLLKPPPGKISFGMPLPPPLKADLNYACVPNGGGSSSAASAAAPAVPALAISSSTNPIVTTTSSSSLPLATVPPSAVSELFEKENVVHVQQQFKSRRSATGKSKLFKGGSRRSRSDRTGHGSGSISCSSSAATAGPQCSSRFSGKPDPSAASSSTTPIGCLASQGASLYPHIPIITPFQSPMISVFPSTSDFYSRSLTTSYKPNTANSSLINSSVTNHTYNPSFAMDPRASTALSSSSSSTSSSSSNNTNISLKPPTYALGANNITFAHQNLYQFQQNQLRYYSYLQPGSPFFGQHSTTPLTANIYPYMPF